MADSAATRDAGTAASSDRIRARELLGVVAVAMLAGLVRALPWATVFHKGQIVFAPGDAMYHLRRAYFTFERFPDVLLRDPYVNYPDGAPIPWPPLFDIVTGGMARLLASDVAGFEAVMAWAPPVFGALTVVPIYLLARELAGRLTALAACVFFALLPISVLYGRIGNPDHHCAVALVGATLLWIVTKLVAPRGTAVRTIGLGCALAAARVALLMTWHGSLLYLGLAELTLAAAGLFGRRADLLWLQAASAAASLAVVASILGGFPTPLGGLYSSIAPSRLHLLALLGVLFVASVGAWRMRASQAASIPVQMTWMAGAALVFTAAVMAFPGPREGLVPALQFLTMEDGVGARTAEQLPLFSFGGRRAGAGALHTWGYFAFLIPFAPLGAWLFVQEEERRAQAWVVGGWAAFFAVLALTQRRYGNDLAASAAVGFALWGRALVRVAVTRLSFPRGIARASVALLALLLILPSLRDLYLPWARRAHAKWSEAPGYEAAPLPTAAWSLHRFTRAIRAVTPETSGFLEEDGLPEYGVVAHANLGHAIQWQSRRPTPTDPFWAYIGPENWQRSFELLAAPDESRALELASELRARFVVTAPNAARGTVAARLHGGDGNAQAALPPLERFRLVTEGPRGGVPLAAIFGATAARSSIPYKLFEIVEGAMLEVEAPPGSKVEASVGLVAPSDRHFRYAASATTGSDGVARIRVPYANAPADGNPLRVRADSRWRIAIRSESGTVIERREAIVPESAVLSGERVLVSPQGTASPARS